MSKQQKANSQYFEQLSSGPTQTQLRHFEFLWAWNQELTKFYSQRLQQYWSLPMQAIQCQSPQDWRGLQDQFLEKLANDYRQETSKLVDLTTGLDAISSDETSGGYEASILKAQKDAAAIIEQAKAQAEHIVKAAAKRADSTNGKSKAQRATA